ncbi:MAG: hypothetical protein IMF09_08925 [Proteobacteria bacterium]|nr:hypothetical protein [Pseudomonadota bacterium]
MPILKTLIIACTLLLCAGSSFANDENGGSGTVAETMIAGGYVYVRLEDDNTWIAASKVPVSVGDSIKYTGGSTMKDFNSRTLKRSFDTIFFVMNLEVFKTVDADKHATAATNDPHAVTKSTPATPPKAGEITPLDGGKTIAAVHADSAKLKGQKVSIRARVMKISLDIVGKNWVTLQDGTGTVPGNRLLATSSEIVAVGDTVTVSGMINTNVDLGSGYTYSVLLENATFSN